MRNRLLRVALAVTVLAALVLALASVFALPAHADEPTRGWIMDQGAPLYSADPNSPLCALGCTEPDTTPVTGTPVNIICRSEFGYLKVLLPTSGPAWVFAADVHAFGTPRPCGLLDA
jgi:hypothetical protein